MIVGWQKERTIEKQEYLALLQADAVALAVAARLGLTSAVPSCPGWSVADLIVHTGGVHRAQANIVSTRVQEPSVIKRDMFESGPDLLPWIEEGAAILVDALRPAWLPGS